MLAAPSLRIYRFAADQCCFATTPVVRPELMPNLQMRNATAEQSYVSRTSARASLKAAHACTDDVVAYATILSPVLPNAAGHVLVASIVSAPIAKSTSTDDNAS